MPNMARQAATFLFGALAVAGLLVAAQSQFGGACTNGCQPWEAVPACVRGGSMDLRFELTQSIENSPAYQYYPNGGSAWWLSSNFSDTVSYGFCPVVDQLQSFRLKYAALEAVGNIAAKNISQLTNESYLGVFGMGPKLSTQQPTNETDSRVLVVKRTSQCPADKPYALVTFLVLNVTMTNGKYLYVKNFDQGVQIGFQPTCTDWGACIMQDNSIGNICIGNPGRQNCARCVGSYNDIANTTINVWTSYYGTDFNGRKLMSGSSNPLAFEQFTVKPIYNTVANAIEEKVGSL